MTTDFFRQRIHSPLKRAAGKTTRYMDTRDELKRAKVKHSSTITTQCKNKTELVEEIICMDMGFLTVLDTIEQMKIYNAKVLSDVRAENAKALSDFETRQQKVLSDVKAENAKVLSDVKTEGAKEKKELSERIEDINAKINFYEIPFALCERILQQLSKEWQKRHSRKHVGDTNFERTMSDLHWAFLPVTDKDQTKPYYTLHAADKVKYIEILKEIYPTKKSKDASWTLYNLLQSLKGERAPFIHRGLEKLRTEKLYLHKVGGSKYAAIINYL